MTSTFNGSFAGSRSFSRSLPRASSRRGALLAMAAASLFAGGAAQAQDATAAEARVAPAAGGQGMACPHPVNITVSRNSGAASPDVSMFPAAYQSGGLNGGLAGSVFNQTAINKWFGHTFKIPQSKQLCCQYREARLVVTYKSLGNASNDGSRVYWGPGGANHIVAQGMDAAGHIWAPSAGAPAGNVAGQTVTHTFVIPANVVATGSFSLWAQDDTAVTSVRMTVTGCCVDPTEPAR
jgi:hypothetical protein